MTKAASSLDLIQIASPCPASWDGMKGDERMRFCSQCSLHVYNLSDMSREEAEHFVSKAEGRTCVRFFRREDGTVLTRDCPVGLHAVRRRLVRAVAALAGMLAALVTGTLFAGRLKEGIGRQSTTYAEWIKPGSTQMVALGVMALEADALLSPLLEAAESPLPKPTADQSN
jgi:hypothetical protein